MSQQTTPTMNQSNRPASAATDVPELFTDLDGGVFETLASTALSQVAAAVTDHEKVGEVTMKFKMEHIPGTHQVRVHHTLHFTRPTGMGKSSEEMAGSTVLHVGKFGRLSLAQPSLLDEGRQSTVPGL